MIVFLGGEGGLLPFLLCARLWCSSRTVSASAPSVRCVLLELTKLVHHGRTLEKWRYPVVMLLRGESYYITLSEVLHSSSGTGETLAISRTREKKVSGFLAMYIYHHKRYLIGDVPVPPTECLVYRTVSRGRCGRVCVFNATGVCSVSYVRCNAVYTVISCDAVWSYARSSVCEMCVRLHAYIALGLRCSHGGRSECFNPSITVLQP